MPRRLLLVLAALALLAPAGALAARRPAATVTYRGTTGGRAAVTVKVRAGRVGRGGRLSGTIVVSGLCSADETWSARRAG